MAVQTCHLPRTTCHFHYPLPQPLTTCHFHYPLPLPLPSCNRIRTWVLRIQSISSTKPPKPSQLSPVPRTKMHSLPKLHLLSVSFTAQHAKKTRGARLPLRLPLLPARVLWIHTVLITLTPKFASSRALALSLSLRVSLCAAPQFHPSKRKQSTEGSQGLISLRIFRKTRTGCAFNRAFHVPRLYSRPQDDLHPTPHTAWRPTVATIPPTVYASAQPTHTRGTHL